MKKYFKTLLIAGFALTLAACSTSTDSDTNSSSESSDVTSVITSSTEIGTVNNSLAEDKESLIESKSSQFQQAEYTDEETGLSITYNIYLPENYDETKEYPTVVFIGDSTTAGDDPIVSLTQGLGANVWASDEWQDVNETIVLVPTYPETILDDHDGYTTTDYVDLTKRFIDYASEEYAVDTNRIYGTGQSMGAMTTLILASTYEDLYAGVMIVDGQWDVSTLSGLESQNIVYFAAEDDQNAWSGSQEVMEMFDNDNVDYTYTQWDATWSPDELSSATEELVVDGKKAYFISWESGTIEIDESSPMANMGSAAYHMASFDYAYRSIAVMEWLFQQSK